MLYNNAIDTFANASDADVTLTVMANDAQRITGSFAATVIPVNNRPGSASTLSGTFSTCRVPDFLPR